VTQSVTLSSTGTGPVTVSSATLTGSGFTLSGATFPLTLNAGQTATLNIQLDLLTAGATTGKLTIVSNSSTNSTASINLTGTGEPLAVTVSWNAPTGSTDPVAGYIVLRAPAGSSSYQKLNASAVTATSYVDSTVQAGATYDYVVESVDASGVDSSPSTMASATTP
jgi:hypothetical protein